MEVTGRIIAALERRSGVSQTTGKPWVVAPYVLETIEQYPKHVSFEVFGEDRINRFNIQIGDNLTVSIDIDAREYNKRWYNQIRAWNVVKTVTETPATTSPLKEMESLPFASSGDCDSVFNIDNDEIPPF